MLETKNEKLEKDWTKVYTLTPDQARCLIEDKLKRAQVQFYLRKREALQRHR